MGGVNFNQYTIQAVYFPDGACQFQNLGSIRPDEVEFEINGKFRPFEMRSSVSIRDSEGHDGRLPNFARVLTKVNIAVSLFTNRQIASNLYFTSSRPTFSDVALSWDQEGRPWRVQFDVRNLFNVLYNDPIALAGGALRGPARSVCLKLTSQIGG